MLRNISRILNRTAPDRSPDQAGPLRFAPGDTFRGTVVQARAEGEVLILARGAKLRAFTTRPLKTGENHLFQVRAAGERILLKVVEGNAAEPASALRLWASGRPGRTDLGRTLQALAGRARDEGLSDHVRSLLSVLRERLPALLYRGPREDGAQWLGRQLRESGLFLESRAARLLVEGQGAALRDLTSTDLKGILLALKAALGEREPGDALARQVDQALQVLHQDQMLNHTAWKEGLGWFWFIPGHPDDGFRGGELFARKPGEDEELFLSLTLDFTRLGRIDVAVSLHRSVVSLRILVETRETADVVESRLQELREGLAATGLETGTIACRERREDDPEGAPFVESAALSGAVDVVI